MYNPILKILVLLWSKHPLNQFAYTCKVASTIPQFSNV